MQPIRQSLAIVAATLLWLPVAPGAQTWTYQFTPTAESQPYQRSCGECSGIVGQNADVAGTFTLLLNWETNTGKILELNDHLVNVVNEIYNGPGLGTSSVPSVPSTKEYGIVTPSRHPTVFMPGQITYSNGLGHFSSTGIIESPTSYQRVGLPYEVWFTPTSATLNMAIPIIDNFITVTGATAAFQSSAWSGDLNNDGRVDGRDYVIMRNSTGAAADYDAWRWSYGNVYFGGGAAVPEPASVVLVLTALAACVQPLRRAR